MEAGRPLFIPVILVIQNRPYELHALGLLSGTGKCAGVEPDLIDIAELPLTH